MGYTLDRLVGTVFKTYWDVYALSISIGMMHDCQIESDDMVPEGYDAEPKSVPRKVKIAFADAVITSMWLKGLITAQERDQMQQKCDEKLRKTNC